MASHSLQNGGESMEQITVSAGTLEADVLTVRSESVDQNPVRGDVAIATALELPTQWVVLL
jgi:hypothetical protein